MADVIEFDMYRLEISDNGTYMAEVIPDRKCSRIEIPEEYNGIPITEVYTSSVFKGDGLTICVSKNVKHFMHAEYFSVDNLPYLVEVSPENPWLCSDDKAVFSKDKTILYAFTARNDESYTIPGGVRIIWKYAFIQTNTLKALNFPEGLEEIGDKAFYGVRNILKEVRLPGTIKKIGSEAFYGIWDAEIFILPENIEEMAPDAFSLMNCLSPVYLPDCFDKPEYTIPNYYFAPEYIIDKNSRTLTIIDGVIYTKDMKVLLAVTRKVPGVVSVPEGVEVIGSYASAKNNNIREIILPGSVHTIKNGAFEGSALERISLDNVKVIEQQAFCSCGRLIDTGKITAERIGDECFYFCRSLEKGYLTNVKEIGEKAFFNEKNPEIIVAGAPEKINNSFGKGSTVKVSDPDTGEIEYAVKIFEAEATFNVKGSEKFINGLFGGEDFIDFIKYDEYFETVCNKNCILSKFEAAHYRITYPKELSDYAREIYTEYLKDCAADVLFYMLEEKNASAKEIAEFPYLKSISEENFTDLIRYALKHGLVEITALLMREMYLKYLDNHAIDIFRQKLDKKDTRAEEIINSPYLDYLKQADVLELITYSAKQSQPEFTAFLMNYNNERFSDSDDTKEDLQEKKSK